MIESDVRVVDAIREFAGKFAVYLGAGASLEAGVPSGQEICNGIRARRLGNQPTPELMAQVDRELRWATPAQRYITAIQSEYPNSAQRVEFFRNSLRGVQPAFVHHATAALMRQGYLRPTAITTNFDKLLESAFVQQGTAECRALRTDDELRYYDPMSGHFVIKLHGDYDTENILNTRSETSLVTDRKREAVEQVVFRGGLLVLGAAGYESSVLTLFRQLLSKIENGSLLTFGLYWGVYVGAARPDGIKQDELEQRMRTAIDAQVNPEIAGLIEDAHKTNPSVAFFPVWGAGSHLLGVIDAIKSAPLRSGVERYLDHEMRLRTVFRRVGLSYEGVESHLDRLREQRRRVNRTFPDFDPDRHVVCVAQRGNLTVRAIYADITERRMMSADEFRDQRRAVVSPEDTCISAGGGIAYNLLKKAGPALILPELGKLSRTPLAQGSVAVTSAGDLPLHYVFHAAAVTINRDGGSEVSSADVSRTMTNVMRLAEALEVTVLWAPLLGSGTAGFGRSESLRSMLTALAAWTGDATVLVNITILEEPELHRDEVERAFDECLAPTFTLAGRPAPPD